IRIGPKTVSARPFHRAQLTFTSPAGISLARGELDVDRRVGVFEVDALGPRRVALERRLDLQLLVALHVDLLRRRAGGDAVDGDLRARRRGGERDGPAGAAPALVDARG